MNPFDCHPPLTLGVIGGGLNSEAGHVHFSATQMDGRWKVVAGAFSRNAEINQATAKRWHIDANRVYADWRTLIQLEQGKLDAVLVLTPTTQHAGMVTEVLEAGFAVICEKALATSLEEIQPIARVMTDRSGFLAVTYNYSGYPMIRELRARIRAGELGALQQLHFEMPQEGFVRTQKHLSPPQSWRLKDGPIPMISHDLGLHLYHLAWFLSEQQPEQVMADYASYAAFPEIIDDVRIWARYGSQLRANYWFSKAAIGHRNGMLLRIYGDKGSAEWRQSEPETLRVASTDGSVKLLDRGAKANLISDLKPYQRMKPGHPAGYLEAFANLYNDIADALIAYRNGQDPNVQNHVFGLEHSHSCLEFFSAASASAASGQWVELQRIK